jgi:putative PIN family toxin of toxin-antitoxin system
MRLVVLDTNVIVSAGIQASGAPARIVMDWVLEGQVQLVTCPSLSSEYREVVEREKFRRYGFPPFWLEFAVAEGLELPEPEPWLFACPDPKDAPFLALAYASGAWLVTGNLRHFPEEVRGGVGVISPADYLAYLAGGSESRP